MSEEGTAVLVDDGEGRAADVVLDTQGGTELLDERGLPHPHLAKEGEEALLGESPQKLLCHLRQLFYIANLNVNH